MKDVYADVDVVRKAAGITQFKAKFVKRKYNFGEPEVPTGESQWLKVVYPFSGECLNLLNPISLFNVYIEPQLSEHLTSPNFARIFGTRTSAFELLVLKRKIMGPCWLQVKNPTVEHKGVCL